MVVTLTLMLYTISLHIASIMGASHVRHLTSSLRAHLSDNFLQQLGVVIFVIMHAIPGVGIFAVTSAQLAFMVRSPTVVHLHHHTVLSSCYGNSFTIHLYGHFRRLTISSICGEVRAP